MRLKVKPLEWYMEDYTAQDLADEGYVTVPADFNLVGRDGYYCRGNDVWFEVRGKGYWSYRKPNQHRGRDYFCYSFKVNDEKILPSREVEAMEQVLKTNRDSTVRKALTARLQLHYDSVQLRDTGRRAAMSRIRILGR